MRNTWRQLFRRLAAGGIICGSLAWSSAMCYAAIRASDTASDPVYADGWQGLTHAPDGTPIGNGDNGGFGFTSTGWDFDSGYFWDYAHGGPNVFYAYNQNLHAIDDGLKAGTQFSNPFNNVGRSWTAASIEYGVDAFGNPKLTLPRGGRGFSELLPGETFSVTIDNPAERRHFKGYALRLNGGTGGQHGSICYGNRPCYLVTDPAHPGPPQQWKTTVVPKPKLNVQLFNFQNCAGGNDPGLCEPGDPRAFWTISGSTTVTSTITDLDSAEGGMRIDVTRTTGDAFSVTLTPLANPSAAFTTSGTFANPGVPIDWFQFDNFNGVKSDSGTPPAMGDFNSDGKVDAIDYIVWRNNDGSDMALPNDNGLGAPVRADHYTLWRSNFGNTAGPVTTATDLYIRSMSISNSAASGLGNAAVPEPGTFVYLISAATGTAGLVRRRRSYR
jgi:hypothetical protein